MDSPVLLFALAIAAIVAVPQCQAGYEIVTSGTNCQRIESKADCEAAANELNLKGWRRWTAEEENVGGSPPSCYTWNGQDLYFNKNGQSQQPCNSDSMICICRKREPGPAKDKYCLNNGNGSPHAWICNVDWESCGNYNDYRCYATVVSPHIPEPREQPNPNHQFKPEYCDLLDGWFTSAKYYCRNAEREYDSNDSYEYWQMWAAVYGR